MIFNVYLSRKDTGLWDMSLLESAVLSVIGVSKPAFFTQDIGHTHRENCSESVKFVVIIRDF